MLFRSLEVPARVDLQYSICVGEGWALLGERERALEWLENGVSRGFLAWEFLASHDWFLESLREEERFRKIVERARSEQEQVRALLDPRHPEH